MSLHRRRRSWMYLFVAYRCSCGLPADHTIDGRIPDGDTVPIRDYPSFTTILSWVRR
jgi:hypothetical protein